VSTNAGLDAVAARIREAATPEALFGPILGPKDHQLATVEKLYRKLVSVVHPDKYKLAAELSLAQVVFRKATEFHDLAKLKIDAGKYGDLGAIMTKAVLEKTPTTITANGQVYIVGDVLPQKGDICDLYSCSARGELVVFKIAQSPTDNDLVENEAKVLRRLFPPGTPEEKRYRYLPWLLDSFTFKGKENKTARKANVLAYADGYYSLDEVRGAYSDGLDFRDIVWMFKRGLAALDFVHRQGIVHGAILPAHVLIHPTTHGAKIVDWCYAVEAGAPIKAIVKAYRDSYAPEVLVKKPATSATDIYMLVLQMRRLMKNPPEAMDRFMRGCLLAAPSHRPQDAWALHEELDELLLRLVGKRKYRPLAMPART
jgi:hypothetical protein